MADKMVKADDGVSEVPAPSAAKGGSAQIDPKKAKKVDPKADTLKAEEVEVDQEVLETEEEVVEEVVVETSVASLFEGEELSEEFKNKVQIVFEAAVSEKVASEVSKIQESLEASVEENLQEAVNNRMEDIVENLDKYLDYVVNEWMEENQLAIEAGIKVEMAESFMEGLKSLFEEHNVEVNEETFDAVNSLEEEVAGLKAEANELVDRNIELQKEIESMKAESAFDEMTESLTDVQVERFKILAANLNKKDLEEYTESLKVIKESFFAGSASDEEVTSGSVLKDNLGDEEEVVIEEEVKAPASEYSSINALVEALNTRKANA